MMIRLIIASIFVAGFAYYCAVPLMEDITENPYKLNRYLMTNRFGFTLASLLEITGLVPWHKTLRTFTEYNTPAAVGTDFVKVHEETFDGVRVLIYDPVHKESGGAPAIVYVHGGGFVFSTPDKYHTLTMELAKTLKYVVISIDYRRAPEHPYPVPFQDCVKATLHFLRHAAKYGVNPGRVAIAGDSAGGNLAAAVALHVHSDDSLPKLKFQVLLYPMMQTMDFDTPSMRNNSGDYLLSRFYAAKAWLLYLRGEVVIDQLDVLTQEIVRNNHLTMTSLAKITDRVNWGRRLSESHRGNRNSSHFDAGHPLLAPHFTEAVQDPHFSPLTGATDQSLRRLPPVYLVTCKRDVLRDDGLMYKSRLEEVGVRVYHQEYDFLHGLLSLQGVVVEADMAINDLTSFFLKNAVL